MVTGPLSRAVTVAGLLLGLAPPVAAQRVPVLRQVKVPHPYYFREMYLPQVTGGPTGAAWSPDGRELVYSLGGSLWRQATGATSARQLTDGPGYDHQPDWSPDGRFVAYVSDRDDALELRLLDLRDGTLKQHQLWFLKHRDAAKEEERVKKAVAEAHAALDEKIASVPLVVVSRKVMVPPKRCARSAWCSAAACEPGSGGSSGRPANTTIDSGENSDVR